MDGHMQLNVVVYSQSWDMKTGRAYPPDSVVIYVKHCIFYFYGTDRTHHEWIVIGSRHNGYHFPTKRKCLLNIMDYDNPPRDRNQFYRWSTESTRFVSSDLLKYIEAQYSSIWMESQSSTAIRKQLSHILLTTYAAESCTIPDLRVSGHTFRVWTHHVMRYETPVHREHCNLCYPILGGSGVHRSGRKR